MGRLVAGLEAVIAEQVHGQDETVLAFSAGLGSTLVGTIARKRTGLVCRVVGVEDAPDVQAARLAASFLDFRVSRVGVDPGRARAIAMDIERDAPGLRRGEVLALVPAVAVRQDAGAERILAGFGTTRLPARVREALTSFGLFAPIALATQELPGRARLAACAAALGLPHAFARPRRRAPLRGSDLASAFAK